MTNGNQYVGTGDLKTGSLTKRELFAAMAMWGFISAWGAHDVTDLKDVAHDSVFAADALINELNKNENGKENNS